MLTWLPDRSVLRQHRQALFQRLTSGVANYELDSNTLDERRVTRILVCRPNHRLGNLLALTPLLTELETLFPGAETDIVAAGGIAREIFSAYANVADVFLLPHYIFKSPFKTIRTILAIRNKDYDLVINTKPDSSTGRLIAMLSKSRYPILAKANGSFIEYKGGHFAQNPVRLLREHLSFSKLVEQKEIPSLDIRLTSDESQWGVEALSRIHQQRCCEQSRTIALFTHATGKKC